MRYRHVRPGSIRLHLFHGVNRLETQNEVKNADVVLTTYGTLRSDYMNTHSRFLTEHNWARIILDEGMSASDNASCIVHSY